MCGKRVLAVASGDSLVRKLFAVHRTVSPAFKDATGNIALENDTGVGVKLVQLAPMGVSSTQQSACDKQKE